MDLQKSFLSLHLCGSHSVLLFLVPLLLSFHSGSHAQNIINDTQGLMAFKAAADLKGVLNGSWTGLTNPCGSNQTRPWVGITCNSRGRVASVTVNNLQLNGTFPANSLGRLGELRNLIVSDNSFSGSLPDDLSNIRGLLQVWAQNAHFSGPFPKFLTGAKSLVQADLAGNKLTGPIPNLNGLGNVLLLNLSSNLFTGKIPSLPPNLSTLDLSGNALTGGIPDSLPSSLRVLDLSDNQLTGPIPSNLAKKFPKASFAGNDLCGVPLTRQCIITPSIPASPTVNSPITSPPAEGKKHHRKKLTTGMIVLIVVADSLLLVIVNVLLIYLWRKYSERKKGKLPKKASFNRASSQKLQSDWPQVSEPVLAGNELKPKLVLVEGCPYKFELEDLLGASAEMIGKGSLGTAYKAVLSSGIMLAVKRLKDVKDVGKEEFEQLMERLGRLSHPNLLPLRAHYYTKQEKLLVYDFIKEGSLFSLLHDNRGTPEREPLEWSARIRIAKGVSVGLAYLHNKSETEGVPHGNIKSSNILLEENFEVCISEYGLVSLMRPAMAAQRTAGYRAAECTHTKNISQQADVYSFGVLLLELLTGRHPGQSLQGDGIDLPKWVRSVVKEEWTGEVFDREIKSYKNEEEMVNLLQIAMACVTANPAQRPQMALVVKLIEDIRSQDQSLSFTPDSELESFEASESPFKSPTRD